MPNAVFGFGRLDVAAAVLLAGLAAGRACPRPPARRARDAPHSAADALTDSSKLRLPWSCLNAKEESPTQTTLEIEVPADEVEKTFSAVTRAYARRAALPGFRKGHAPEPVVQKRFGGQIREDVLETLLPDALSLGDAARRAWRSSAGPASKR